MSNKYKILVVEDEPKIRSFMGTILETNGYKVVTADTCNQGILMFFSHCPDLIVLDLGLPDIDGIDILQQIREWSNIPVIVVSARTEEADKVKALDMGADDYIAKPFGTSELLARIRTALRHVAKGGSGNAVGDVFTLRGLTINFDKRQITVDGKDVHLTQIEFKIVSLLAKSAGRVLTYDYIITELWGPYAIKDNQILRVNMANIRRKLEKNPAQPQYIFTEVGVGYRMAEE
mgnify:CR=1 FL=1